MRLVPRRHCAQPFDPPLLPLLRGIRQHGSLSQAAQALGLSYRYAWGMTGKWERALGRPLVVMRRGRGATLTPFSEKLLWADDQIRAHLGPQLKTLAVRLGSELARIAASPELQLTVHASHDLALIRLRDWLARKGGLQLDLQFQGSSESLASFARARCHMAGFHTPEGGGEAPRFLAQWLKPKTDALIKFAIREQGLMVQPGNPKGIRGLRDLTRGAVRFINRQRGSGTRLLLDQLLRNEGVEPSRIQGYDGEEFTHLAVAATVAGGMADTGFGIRAAASQYGLDFVRLTSEQYFLACKKAALGQPGMERLLKILQGREFKAILGRLPGYSGKNAGEVLAVADAFPTLAQGRRKRPLPA